MKSIREIYKIGKGPSSSHTMGPERAAKLFLSRYPQADRFLVTLYGSLCKTGVGHGTDRVLRDTLGERTEVLFSKDSWEGMHPNTMDFTAFSGDRKIGTLRVESVGGGDIRIPGEPMSKSGEEVYVPRDRREKAMQRALMQYRAPRNYELVKQALRLAGREDLIGFGKQCLIRPTKAEAIAAKHKADDAGRRDRFRNEGGRRPGRGR